MPTPPTAQELCAQPYVGSSPPQQGMTGENFAQQIRENGQRLRWWQRWPTEGRPIFEEQTQTLDGQPIEDARVLIDVTTRVLGDAAFGQVVTTETTVASIPGEVEFAPGDLICLLGDGVSEAPLLARAVIERGTGSVDEVPDQPVGAVTGVMVGGVRMAALDSQGRPRWEAAEIGIRWLRDAPAAGTMFTVEYRHWPKFRWALDERAALVVGTDSKRLPQFGVIQMVHEE